MVLTAKMARFVKAYKQLNLGCAIAFCLVLSACHKQEAKPVAVFRLFDLFQPDDLIGKVTPEDAGWKRVEWQAPDMAPWTPPPKPDTNGPQRTVSQKADLNFRAVHDLGEPMISQGQLTSDITGPTPVLHFALKANRGGAESVKFIEVRMKISGAKQVWLRPERGASVDDEALVKWASQSESWKTSADVEENKPHTYRFEIPSDRDRSGRGGGGRGRPDGAGGGAAGPNAGGGARGGPDRAGGGDKRPDDAGKRPDGAAKTTDGADKGPEGAGKVTDGAAKPRDGANRGPDAAPGAGRGGPVPALTPPAPGGAPGSGQGSGDLRHFILTFRDGQSAKFSIESVRFVSEREEKLKDASGQQWAGLAEIYRATLAAKTPESIRIPLRELPQKAWMDLAIGTKEDAPIKFKVAISRREGDKDSAAATVFERTVTIPNRWQPTKIDLSAYAGKTIVVEMSLAGEKKGLWGYWGTPVVRSPLATVSSASGGNQAKRKPRGVIFLVIDTLRKDHLNIYGYPRETLVYLKKFAEEGTAFRHTISQATMTKISIPSMVTSLYPMSHTVLGFDHGLPASAKTIAEVFREEGYSTVAYSSVPFTGKANNMHQGYDELHEVASISDNEYRSKTARPYVDRLIPWLEQHRDEPFFVFLHVFDPHSPFRPRPPYDTLWGAPGSRDRLAELEADMKTNNIRTGMDNMPNKAEYLKTGNNPDELLKIYTDWYDGSIRGVDAEIGRLLEALRELGLEQDTLMVWSTDHGEEFWEHGRLFHGQSVYGELNQVPLVFHWPNNPDIRKGVMIDQQVENLDIMPTILALAGIPGPTNMQGRSLVTLLNGSGVATWPERPAITQAMVGDLDAGPPGGGPPGGGGPGAGPPGAAPGGGAPAGGAPAGGPPAGGAPGGNSDRKPEKAHFGIIDHGWKLVRKELEPDAVEELYEHPIDSLNLTNVIKSDGSPSHVKALAQTLEAWKTRARTAQLPSDESMTQEMSSEELRRLRALGYIGGGTTPKPGTNTAAPNTATNATTPSMTNTATNSISKTNVPGAGSRPKEDDQ
jgi:arylsulfatase A-like enzyme